jgi:3-dehydro-L-gulonate 2-dehydrogenase
MEMRTMGNYILINSEVMKSEFFKILKKTGFNDHKAQSLADIFTVNSLEGVYTHGVNRFSRFISNVREGYINHDAEPSLIHGTGSLEQWNGNSGPGPLNALFATGRAIDLSDRNGIGLVSLANTNHWMRAGYYGWHASRKGYVFIGWTNTIANMPAWGAKDVRMGNNPFIIAIPYEGEAIVLDFAMTQFSYGKMEAYAAEGRQLPYPGGYNKSGELTTDPSEILETWRTVPIGYWKGAGFSLLLDILAVILSGGKSTGEITKGKAESGVSQVFIAINIKALSNYPSISRSIREIIDDLHGSQPVDDKTIIRYPGENIIKIREESLKTGIPVNPRIWNEILDL